MAASPRHELPDFLTPTKVGVSIPSARPLRQREALLGPLPEPIGALEFGGDDRAVEARMGVLQGQEVRVWKEGNDGVVDFSWQQQKEVGAVCGRLAFALGIIVAWSGRMHFSKVARLGWDRGAYSIKYIIYPNFFFPSVTPAMRSCMSICHWEMLLPGKTIEDSVAGVESEHRLAASEPK
jgi:hypothetical protein